MSTGEIWCTTCQAFCSFQKEHGYRGQGIFSQGALGRYGWWNRCIECGTLYEALPPEANRMTPRERRILKECGQQKFAYADATPSRRRRWQAKMRGT